MPLIRRTLTDAAVDALRSRLLAGEWEAGAPLRQEALAGELGVSRIPLREALRQLEAEGLVSIQPHRGAVVSPLPLDEAAELFELRALIEADLARRAVPRLTRADDAAMRAHAAAFEQAVTTGNVSAWGDTNRRFHFALYAAADRPRTLETVARLHTQSDRFLRLQLTLSRGTSRAVREHRAIAAAARARDTARVTRLIRDHILAAGRALVNSFDRLRPSENILDD